MRRHSESLRRVKIGAREVYAKGLDHGFWGDFYHNAMTITWPAFVGVTAAIFIVVNALFALVYTLGTSPVSDAGNGKLVDYFYFSIETLATVGYGDMHPQTNYGHLVASVETFIGLFLTAVLTGLIFARFSRPRARFIFADVMVVTTHDGEPVLSLRLANGRLNLVSGASAQLWVTRIRQNAEGVRFRGFEQLKLERAQNPFFALSWTLFHKLDATSPIFGLSSDQLQAIEAQFLVTITGHDDSAAQSVQARQTYTIEHIRWGHRYVDIIRTDESGRNFLDYALIHDVEPFEPQPASASNPS